MLSFQRLLRKHGRSLRPEYDTIFGLLRDLRPVVASGALSRAALEGAAHDAASLAPGALEAADASAVAAATAAATASGGSVVPAAGAGGASGAASPWDGWSEMSRAGIAINPPGVRAVDESNLAREIVVLVLMIQELHARGAYGGDVDALLALLSLYCEFLPVSTKLLLLGARLRDAHPSNATWMSATMEIADVHFRGESDPVVRKEALGALRQCWSDARFVHGELVTDMVLRDVLVAGAADPDVSVRTASVKCLVRCATECVCALVGAMTFRLWPQVDIATLEAHKHTLIEVLAVAARHPQYTDTALAAAAGLVTIFAESFVHLPTSRSLLVFHALVELIGGPSVAPDARATAIEAIGRLGCTRAGQMTLQLGGDTNFSAGAAAPAAGSRTLVSPFLYGWGACTPQSGSTLNVAAALEALLRRLRVEPSYGLFDLCVDALSRFGANRYVLTGVMLSPLLAPLCESVKNRTFGACTDVDVCAVALVGGSSMPLYLSDSSADPASESPRRSSVAGSGGVVPPSPPPADAPVTLLPRDDDGYRRAGATEVGGVSPVRGGPVRPASPVRLGPVRPAPVRAAGADAGDAPRSLAKGPRRAPPGEVPGRGISTWQGLLACQLQGFRVLHLLCGAATEMHADAQGALCAAAVRGLEIAAGFVAFACAALSSIASADAATAHAARQRVLAAISTPAGARGIGRTAERIVVFRRNALLQVRAW